MKTEVTRRNFLQMGIAAVAGTATIGIAGCAAPVTNSAAASSSTESLSLAAESSSAAVEAATPAANSDWLGAEPEMPTSFAEEYDVDVVVCGLGVAGVAAMRAAAEAGCSVVGFDKSTATRSSNEICAFGSELYAQRYPDVAAWWEGARPLALNAIANSCECRNDMRIISKWMDINGEAVDWWLGALDESEYSFGTSANGNKVEKEAEIALSESVYPLPEHYDPFSENMPCIPGVFRMGGKQRGTAFLVANRDIAEAAGAQFFPFTPAVRLITEGGRVTGVVAQTEDGDYVRANAAKGVVLATGDFMNDEAMLREFLPAILDQGYVPFGDENWYTANDKDGKSANTGDGHRMAAWVGGKMQDFGASMSHFSKSENSSVFGTLPYLMLSEEGTRFMNEDVQGQQFCERIRQLPNRRAIYLFDSKFEEQMPWMPYGHGKLPHTTQADVDQRIADGLLETADTLEELLAKFDIDAEVALESIEHYNELCHAGIDTDFGKVSTRLFPLENPPYYANYMTRGDDLVTMSGIVSDPQCHAYNADNEVIPGLYVAGNVMGGRFANIYPEIFMGYSVSSAMAFGREAGINVAAEA